MYRNWAIQIFRSFHRVNAKSFSAKILAVVPAVFGWGTAVGLQAQGLGVSLSKSVLASPYPREVDSQWVAANQSPAPGTFFIVEKIPAGYQLVGLSSDPSPAVPLSIRPSLPTSSGSVTCGPLTLSPGQAVTFKLRETLTQGQAKSSDEAFFLVPVGPAGSAFAAVTPTIPVLVSGAGASDSVLAEPNFSTDGQPIRFRVNLGQSALIRLSLYSLMGEKVYGAELEGASGDNWITWALRNSANQGVASGLYFYCVEISGSGLDELRRGKVLVLH